VKDLVDLVLLSGYRPIAKVELSTVLEAVFRSRATHEIPKSFPHPPDNWRDPYRKLSETLPIAPDIDEAFAKVAAFLDPVFASRNDEQWWNPDTQLWVTGKPLASPVGP
jgi:hypothetical protein